LPFATKVRSSPAPVGPRCWSSRCPGMLPSSAAWMHGGRVRGAGAQRLHGGMGRADPANARAVAKICQSNQRMPRLPAPSSAVGTRAGQPLTDAPSQTLRAWVDASCNLMVVR